MLPNLTLFHDSSIDTDVVEKVVEELKITYEIGIRLIKRRELEIITFNKARNQYDGQKLLNVLIDKENITYFLWLVNEDLYVPGRNFVFGLATQFYGGIVSFFRLESTNMKIKESIHECGHILGLGHCKEVCVMQYSKNLEEAILKPTYLCWKCKAMLKETEKKIDKNKD